MTVLTFQSIVTAACFRRGRLPSSGGFLSRSRLTRSALAALCLASGWGPASAQIATEWSGGHVIDLGKLAGAISSQARAINNLGEVVGYSQFNTYSTKATAWIGGVQSKLGGLPGDSTVALGVNDFGAVVGTSVVDNLAYAVEWNGGGPVKLAGTPDSGAEAINDWGEAVGQSNYGGVYAASAWSGGALVALHGLPRTTESQANAVNALGQAVGYIEAGPPDYPIYAVDWSGKSPDILDGLPGSDISDALGVNDLGRVVGWSDIGGLRHAVEWIGGAVVDLGGLPGSTQSEAYGVNDLGQVVGDSIVKGEDIATEWSGGAVIDLGAIAGAPSSVAYAINDFGQIVGWTDPIPEPSTWAMLVIGFAGLGYATRRRSHRRSAVSA